MFWLIDFATISFIRFALGGLLLMYCLVYECVFVNDTLLCCIDLVGDLSWWRCTGPFVQPVLRIEEHWDEVCLQGRGGR